jgi:hypothetical protein
MNSGTSDYLSAVWGSSGTDVFAVSGEYGDILHYDGSGWTSMPSNNNQSLRDIWGVTGSQVYAVGDGGTLFYYDTEEWRDFSYALAVYDDLTAIWGDPQRGLFIATAEGTILHRPGSYVECSDCYWKPMETGTDTYLYDVWGTYAYDVFVVGTGGAIMHYSLPDQLYLSYMQRPGDR